MVLNKFKVRFANDYFNGKTFRCILLDANNANLDTSEFYADIAADEIADGGGYTANGVVVTPTVQVDNANDKVNIAFSNAQWDPSTINASHYAIIEWTGNPATSPIVLINAGSGGAGSSNNALFQVTFPSPVMRF